MDFKTHTCTNAKMKKNTVNHSSRKWTCMFNCRGRGSRPSGRLQSIITLYIPRNNKESQVNTSQMSQRTNIEAQRSRTGNDAQCVSVKPTSLYITKAFGCLVWGETFDSVVSLYIDHRHGLPRSSKAHRCKLLHIKKKKKRKRKRPWPPSQTVTRKLRQHWLYLIKSIVTFFFLAINREILFVCWKEALWSGLHIHFQSHWGHH